jgi:hypothetical protein
MGLPFRSKTFWPTRHSIITPLVAPLVHTAAQGAWAPEGAPLAARRLHMLGLVRQVVWSIPIGIAFTDLVGTIARVDGPSMQVPAACACQCQQAPTLGGRGAGGEG